MTPSRPARSESLAEAHEQALVELAEEDPTMVVLDAGPAGGRLRSEFARQHLARHFELDGMGSTLVSVAAGLALAGRVAFARAPAALVPGEAYAALRQSVCQPSANVKVVATHGGLPPEPDGAGPPMLEDLGLARGLPGMTVVVPADGPQARSATHALHGRPGPAYLRLSAGHLPAVTDGTFAVGKAAELRPGQDLTIVALGAMVAPGLEVAEDLARVGVSTRVLDFASVKPFDEPALLRAARDTGAILVLEEHSVLTGVGALVASTTSENYPVPVRRVGVPDVFGEAGEPRVLRDRYGLSVDRMRDEAWELLRARGKVQ